MGKKRSIGVTIVSKTEIVLGAIVLALLVWALLYVILGIYERGYMQYVIFYGIPYSTLLIAGVLSYQLKPLGRILNLILAYSIIVIFSNYIIGMITDFDFLGLGLFLFSPLFIIFFFSRSRIKEQFKQ